MYPQTHFLFSYLVGLILAKFGVFDYKVAFFVALAGMLVDIDHFLMDIFCFDKANFRHAWNKSIKGVYHAKSWFHHEIGTAIITVVIIILYFVSETWFWIIGLGFYSHLFLDYAHLNVLKIRERTTIKEFGITERINKFEILLDIFLIIGIVLLLF